MSETSNLIQDKFFDFATTTGLNKECCDALIAILNNKDFDDKKAQTHARTALQLSAKFHMRDKILTTEKSLFTDRVFSKASNKRLYYWAQNINSPV